MNLKKAIQRREREIIQIRRELHRIPEPAYTEDKTSRFVAERLQRLGIDCRTGIARYGVVGIHRFAHPGKTVMLRCELDALPVVEQTGLPFASTHPHAMHACGHDGHMAMVLGAAMVLQDLDPPLCGAVKYLFQPAEEGPGGAAPMIAEGVLKDPHVDTVLGLHLWPGLPEGSVGIRPGPVMAAMDRFDLQIKGKGGHGAMPHLCVDALEVGTQVINALQRIVSRQMNPLKPSVVTIGQFQAGTAFNIIAGEAHLSGTTRTFDTEVWHSWPERIERIARGVCTSMGAQYQLDYQPGYPVTINDATIAQRARYWAGSTVGEESVVTPEPTMGGEDFAFYLERVPGCFLFLGCGRPDASPLHSPTFDFSEEILLTGVEIYCHAIMDLLSSKAD
ncbi:MAG: amidohydrolase [Desulfatitalea sp.]|nr:amidohydrolase [Desulfatitalea sp.]